MSLIRIASPEVIRPRHVVMIVLLVLTLAGSCLLSSGAPSTILPDGAKEWSADSWFRALVETLNLHYAQPTPTGSEIKNLVFGMGTALAVLSIGIALALRPRRGEELDENDTVLPDPTARDQIGEVSTRKHLPPLLAAQTLMLFYVAWSFVSIVWSEAGDIALYGSLELALYTLWAFVLAHGLSRASARFGAYGLAGVGVVTAAMALGYVHERNPTLRASYPIGNPTFLAACLIPPMLVVVCVLVAQVRDFGNPRWFRRGAITVLCFGIFLVLWSAFRRADARGAVVGLAAGFLALFFFAWKWRGKLAVLVVASLGGVLGVWLLLPRITTFSPTGRDASFRLRVHAWRYAFELIGQHRLLGHGQGGYTRKADALASGADALQDPEALNARVDHAHNEWLEVWTDLGSVGLVLVLGALFFTLAAGATTVRSVPTVMMRWILVGLLASLTALIVEETFGVGLRVTGLLPIYYTVIGLVWAFCGPEPPAGTRLLRRYPVVRRAGAILTAVLALAAAYWTVRDFQAARAQYEVAGALERLDWEGALQRADQARRHRLSPQRRLTAQDLACTTYLHVARVHQLNGLRRAAAALQSEPHNQPLLDLADQDIQTAETYCHNGTELLKDLVRKAPSFYNSNWLQYGFQQVRAEIARAHGDWPKARKYDRDSADALARELARRPYDVNMAARYVVARGAALAPDESWAEVCAELCEVLARPLRYNRTPPAYDEVVTRLLTVPAFQTEFLPLYERSRTTSPANDPAQWEPSLGPEILRLAALVWSHNGEDDLAEQTLQQACALYGAVAPRLALGTAACFAELAERRFLNHVVDPGPALRDAAEAIRCAPPSNEGRQLVQGVKGLLMRMQLAAGDETAARATLLELASQGSDLDVRHALSAGYADLVSILMRREGEDHLDEMRSWANRAVECDEANELAWRLKADMAFRDRDDAECVRCLREARRQGAADEIIFQFVDIALRRRPTSKPLLEYSAELAADIRRSAGDVGSPSPPE